MHKSPKSLFSKILWNSWIDSKIDPWKVSPFFSNIFSISGPPPFPYAYGQPTSLCLSSHGSFLILSCLTHFMHSKHGYYYCGFLRPTIRDNGVWLRNKSVDPHSRLIYQSSTWAVFMTLSTILWEGLLLGFEYTTHSGETGQQKSRTFPWNL